MIPNLKPSGPLSQVVFIHDYVQLVFDEESFSICNVAEMDCQGALIRQGQVGFCDALVALIAQQVTVVSSSNVYALALTFERGARLLVLAGDAGVRGPEAFQFNGRNNLIVVEQNT